MDWSLILSYLVGYVVVMVEGEALEKFINLTVTRGFLLWELERVDERRMLLKARISTFKAFRHIAARTGCRIKLIEKGGLPFVIFRLRKRKMLLAGGFFFLVCLYVLTSFVWFIEVVGTEKLPEQEVLLTAEKAGLKIGKPKWLLDMNLVEHRLRQDLPQVAYVGIEVKGTSVIIEVSERVIIDEEDKGPCHLVAVKDGVVQEMLVMVGQPLVSEGETVKKGQILVSGVVYPEVPQYEEENSDEEKLFEPEFVQAKGVVKARVWYESYGEFPVVESGENSTGNTAQKILLRWKERELKVFGSTGVPFQDYRKTVTKKNLPNWRNVQVPVELVYIKYEEVNFYRHYHGREKATLQAQQKALAELRERIPEVAAVKRRKVTLVSQPQDNLVRIKILIETLENIAQTRIFDPSQKGDKNINIR